MHKRIMKYTSLRVWQLVDELTLLIHRMTISEISQVDQFETGVQIRRSIKSVKSNIVEGFSRRTYKRDFIHFLIIAKGSTDETIDHLDTLFKTKSLKNEQLYFQLKSKLMALSFKLYLFINSVKQNHISTI